MLDNNQNIDEILRQNPNAPTSDQSARDFARKLFVPTEERDNILERTFSFTEGDVNILAGDPDAAEWCGESTVGLIEATLASNHLSSDAQDDIVEMMEDSMPTLEHEKTIGHFRFRWTDSSSDPRDNVIEGDIDATGAILNDCWDQYVADFREPQADLVNGVRQIDVDVYFEGGGLHGSTSSHTNRIFLNSSSVVSDDCRRFTTSAHELFHRVEYSYGYVTGTANQRWWVEALGSWSQEYFNSDINDYVNRVNHGLNDPGKGLLSRSYDACHFWKYFGEQLESRSDNVGSETQAIREFLEAYSGNGFDAVAAAATTAQDFISRDLDRFFREWSKANFIKDLDNHTELYGYIENDVVTTMCQRTHGPYRQIAPVTDRNIASNQFSWTSATLTLSAYGSHYHRFSIEPSVTSINLHFAGNPDGGDGRFSTHLIMIKSNRWVRLYNEPNATDSTRNLDFTSDEADSMILVCNGLSSGGNYQISIVESDDL